MAAVSGRANPTGARPNPGTARPPGARESRPRPKRCGPCARKSILPATRTASAPADGQAVPDAVPANTPASPGATLEDKVEIQGQRIDELAQTKVEASQKFPIRITGMALFNAFLNSRQTGGVEYPVTASAPGASSAGATLRQTIIGLEYRGPETLWGGNVHGSVYMDFAAGATNTAVRLRTGFHRDRLEEPQPHGRHREAHLQSRASPALSPSWRSRR